MIMLLLAAQLAGAGTTASPVKPVSPPASVARPAEAIDLSQMPVEEAVMLMFALISKDARDDTRAMLEEMNETRRRRQSMREAQAEMTRELQRLKASARGGRGTGRDPIVESQLAWAEGLPALCGQLRGEKRARCLETAVRRRTLELRAMPVRR